jgi:hypothetical protein
MKSVSFVVFVAVVLAGCSRDSSAEFVRSIVAPVPQSVTNLRLHHTSEGWLFSEHTFIFAFEAASADLDQIRAARDFHEVHPEKVGDSQILAPRYALKSAEGAGIPPLKVARYFVCGPKHESYVYYLFIGEDGKSARFLKMGY